MPLLDEKKRLFGVINPVDLLVIIGVVAVGVVIAGVLFGWGDEVTVAKTDPITYDIVCPNVADYTEGAIKAGDTISKLNTGPIGKVTAVKITPTILEAWDPVNAQRGEFKSAYLVNVIISVEGRGRSTVQGVVVGGATIRNNEVMPIITDRFESAASRVTNLKINAE